MYFPQSDGYSQPESVSSYAAPIGGSYGSPQSPSYQMSKNSKGGPLAFLTNSLQDSPLFNAFQVRLDFLLN